MSSSFHSGRQLPGWGSDLRRLPATTRRTALMLAAFAGLSISGCAGSVPAVPTAGTKTASTSTTSQPGRLKGALALAMMHLDGLPRVASHPFHLVAFKGKGLDEAGATTATTESHWEFTFSRYVEDQPSQQYEVVTVAIPGAGATSMTATVATDLVLSPVEHWDAATDGTAPDSTDFLAPLKAQGANLQGATLSLAEGKVKAEAGGKSVVYDTATATFGTVQ